MTFYKMFLVARDFEVGSRGNVMRDKVETRNVPEGE